MSAPADEMVRELERVLAEAGELGQARTVTELREEVGVGHDDLTAALDVLREHGKAQEVAPGEWSGPDGGEEMPGEPEPLRVSVPDDGAAAAWEALRRLDGANTHEVAEPGPAHAGFALGGANVRLTRAIADELDAAALGQIVKAGLKGVAAKAEFVLEVLP